MAWSDLGYPYRGYNDCEYPNILKTINSNQGTDNGRNAYYICMDVCHQTMPFRSHLKVLNMPKLIEENSVTMLDPEYCYVIQLAETKAFNRFVKNCPGLFYTYMYIKTFVYLKPLAKVKMSLNTQYLNKKVTRGLTMFSDCALSPNEQIPRIASDFNYGVYCCPPGYNGTFCGGATSGGIRVAKVSPLFEQDWGMGVSGYPTFRQLFYEKQVGDRGSAYTTITSMGKSYASWAKPASIEANTAIDFALRKGKYTFGSTGKTIDFYRDKQYITSYVEGASFSDFFKFDGGDVVLTYNGIIRVDR